MLTCELHTWWCRYLVGGAVVGPSGLRLVTKWEEVGTISQFGAVFPLFSLGMQFHFTDHRHGQYPAPSHWCTRAVHAAANPRVLPLHVARRYYRASVGGTVAASALYSVVVATIALSFGMARTVGEALLVAVPFIYLACVGWLLEAR